VQYCARFHYLVNGAAFHGQWCSKNPEAKGHDPKNIFYCFSSSIIEYSPVSCCVRNGLIKLSSRGSRVTYKNLVVVLPFKKEVYKVEDLNYLYSNIGQGYSLQTRCGRFVFRVNQRQQM